MKTMINLSIARLTTMLQMFTGNHDHRASKLVLQPSYWQMSPAGKESVLHNRKN
jgi:hypothetical protein